MNSKELKEHAHLSRKWAMRKATMKEMERCMALDRKARAEQTKPTQGA